MEKLAELVSILDAKTVKSSCVICPRTNKIKCSDDSDFGKLYEQSTRKMCKRCLVSLAKRKMAFLYIKDYFNTTKKKNFSIANIKVYIRDTYTDDTDFVGPLLPLIIRELILCGVIEIFTDRSSNGRRYRLVREDVAEMAEKNKEYLLGKGYGCPNGYKFPTAMKVM